MNRNRFLVLYTLLITTLLLLSCKPSLNLQHEEPNQLSLSHATGLTSNMEVVLSDNLVCSGEEVTVQMFTRMLNASPGIQFRNLEVYNNDLDEALDIRAELFVEESDLNGNGFLDWLDLDGEDNVAPNGDLRSDEEFLHEYARVFTETTTIVAGDRADTYLVDNLIDPTSVTDLSEEISREDSATITVLNPEISLVIEAEKEPIMAGGSADFNITIVNSGDVELTNIRVSHEQIPACDGRILSLAAGAEYIYSCMSDATTEDFVLDVSLSADVGEQLCLIDSSASGEITVIELAPTALDLQDEPLSTGQGIFLPFVTR